MRGAAAMGFANPPSAGRALSHVSRPRCRLIRMNARVDHLLVEVLGLPADQRSAVAAALIDSLQGGDDASVSNAWKQELMRRRSDLQSGAAQGLPWAEVRARLSAL